MNYVELRLQFDSEVFPEILQAELAEIGFDSFLPNGSELKAYVPTSDLKQSALHEILEAYSANIQAREQKEIEHQNWNALWESNYDPVEVDGTIFIGAPFHEVPEGFENTIVLEPNMSFGTGHHPTTHMMLRTLSTMDLSDKRLFDFGAGSGILCIYADQRGANGIGVEIDEHATEAANTNLRLNKCQEFTIIPGGLEKAENGPFDLIVANINRNVIEESAKELRGLIRSGGVMLCAGFFTSDAPALSDFLHENGFTQVDEMSEGEWTLLKFMAS